MDDIRPAIISRLEQYMHQLGWKQSDLAAATKISPAQVSGWFTSRRSISRNHINRIAWALGDARFRQRSNQSQLSSSDDEFAWIDSLDDILNRLLTDAGYSAFTGARQDLFVSRLASDSELDRTKRVIRTGWVHYPPFCSLPEGADPAAKPEGLAVETMNMVAHLMDVDTTWHKYEWRDILNALVHREIDVVCPTLMELPGRLFKVSFSEPLPDIHVGLNVVVHQVDLPKVFVPTDKGRERLSTDLAVHVVEGEIGEALHQFVAPSRKWDRLESFPKAIASLLERAGSGPRYPCIVADHMICLSIVAADSNLKLAFREPREFPALRLTVAAAINLEEPRLLMIINSCIKMLTRTGYFRDVLYDDKLGFGDKLRDVLTPLEEEGSAVQLASQIGELIGKVEILLQNQQLMPKSERRKARKK